MIALFLQILVFVEAHFLYGQWNDWSRCTGFSWRVKLFFYTRDSNCNLRGLINTVLENLENFRKALLVKTPSSLPSLVCHFGIEN